jgi:hypothetical protein
MVDGADPVNLARRKSGGRAPDGTRASFAASLSAANAIGFGSGFEVCFRITVVS